MIRAKFKVDEVADGTLRASPVVSSEPGSENSKFWDATPSGSLEVTATKAGIFSALKVGDEFYLDITPAPKAGVAPEEGQPQRKPQPQPQRSPTEAPRRAPGPVAPGSNPSQTPVTPVKPKK